MLVIMKHYSEVKKILDDHFMSLYSNSNSEVCEAMHYAMSAGGKRIRPLLSALLLDAYGYHFSDYINQISSLELIHTYSLIHDDMPCMDDDDLRRNKPTCHIVYGEAIALLAGDALLTDAFKQMSVSQLEPEKTVQLIQLLSDRSGYKGMIHGQMLDMQSENRTINLEQLEAIHAHKTGCLIAACFEMVSVIVDLDVQVLQEIGRKLGLAFQIQDDVLDIVGDQQVVGKTIQSDIKNHKSTFVNLLGLEQAKAAYEQLFKEIEILMLETTMKDKTLVSQLINDIKMRNR